MSTSRVTPMTLDIAVVDPETQSTEPASNQVVANVSSKELVTISNNAVVPVEPTDFVEIPIGTLILPVVDPTNFDHFKNYIKSKLCYNAAILDKAVVSKRTECMAFQIDMWSLMEHRSTEQRTKPYRGEKAPGKRQANLFQWKDSQYERSSANVENQVTKSFPLTETYQKIKCQACDANGKKLCNLCNGRGHVMRNNNISQCSRCSGSGYTGCDRCASTAYLLVYDQLNIKWHTERSKQFYQNTFLPEKTIRETQNKPIFYEKDSEWTNDIFLTSYDDLFQVIAEKSPVRFEKGIQQQYQDFHFIKLKESTVIRRLKILIRYINVLEIDYKLEGFTNNTKRHQGTNTFTYLQYGQNDKGQPLIYENDYPKNCCGCFGPASGCRCGCSIS